MDWRALEEHFRVAGNQEPGPFGDDAIEWDYSRYARGLGLTGEPGAHDLPHRGCAVLALPPARWDAAEKKYRAWADQRGWALWRFSARPTVAVPDPVVYALGVRAAGEDSLLFARAALPVRPAMGRRLRSEGMSFPLTAGERWLIATDRVRRRMRAETSMRGVVLFIDEAEWVTPAGLAVLMYLLDAHRAWRARMLARPARVYVVLATEREGGLLRMLERFHLTGHTPVLRDRRVAENGSAPVVLRDAEEEYLFGALAAAPVALAEEDVRGLFGASAVERCRAMVERALLRPRREAGQTCFVPDPAVPAGLAPAPPRAMRAIAALYRRRARRGHEHLALAAAALSLAAGDDPLRVAAAVARMPHTAGAMLPLELFEGLDAALERVRPRLHADHVAAWFSLVAHQRAYDRARELAHAIAERELRTWKEMHRVMQVVLCTGRAHLDSCLPPDFWPKLKSTALAGPFMDATCVLGELFWRKRYLSDTDIRQRYEFACECFARSQTPRSLYFERVARFARLVAYRAALQLGIPSNVLSTTGAPTDPPPPQALRTFLRLHQVPAYVTATIVGAEVGAWYPGPGRSFGREERFLIQTLTAATTHSGDLAVLTSSSVGYLSARAVHLLLRDLVDEAMMLMLRRVGHNEQHDLGRFQQSIAGGRVWLMGANALYLEHGRKNVPGRDGFDDLAVTQALTSAGEFAGARDRLMLGFARKPHCPFLLSLLIEADITLSRKALDMSGLAAVADLLEKSRSVITPDLHTYLAAMIHGSLALCAGNFDAASGHFWEAHAAIRGTFDWTKGLKRRAAGCGSRARRASRSVAAWVSGGRNACSIWKTLRAVCGDREGWMSNPSLRRRVAASLEYAFGVLEGWGRHVHDAGEALRLAFFLKEPVDAVFQPLGRDFLSLLAEWAPSFYERLRTAVTQRVGEMDVAAPEGRAMGAALRTIGDAWKDGHSVSVDDSCTRTRVRNGGSRARQARAAERVWYDDATTYAHLWDGDGRFRWRHDPDPTVVAYGYVGCSRTKPVATVLRLRMTRQDDDVVDVDVEARGWPSQSSSKGRRMKAHGEPAAEFLGDSAAARKVRTMIATAAKCRYPTLIMGETGVGKDLVARCIHATSAVRDRPMVVAECASTVESVLESELFGHERGAFTGAHASHSGYFERANGSSLLLDEVDSMSIKMQAALLRVLESGDYRPVGASSSRRSEFRLISAALPRLMAMVDAGQFRQDLFYRISTLRVEVPPLRDRDGDSREIAVAHARSLGLRLTAGALRVIEKYNWPGNVRQLRHCIQAASLHASDRRIGEAAASEAIGGYGGNASGPPAEDAAGLEASWTRALRTLERLGSFGAWDFAKAAEVSRRSAQRHIAQWLREGRIMRVGAGRTTRYGLRL